MWVSEACERTNVGERSLRAKQEAMRVLELWRYPVKSMGGERLAAADVTDLGITGDRGWGVRDGETGTVLTARREPRLLFASAAVEGGALVVTLPDGTRTDRTEDIARWLDRDVALCPAGAEGGVYEVPVDPDTEEDWHRWQGPPDAWHDSARTRVSLVTTATTGEWDARRFRSNVLLDGSGEDGLVGHQVALGGTRLDVTKRVDRCVMVGRAQPGVEADKTVLRRVLREREGFLAIGALVDRAGRIVEGDEVRDLGTEQS